MADRLIAGSFIAKADDIARADVGELRRIEVSLKENYAADPRLACWSLKVGHGILGSKALRQWCKEARRSAVAAYDRLFRWEDSVEHIFGDRRRCPHSHQSERLAASFDTATKQD